MVFLLAAVSAPVLAERRGDQGVGAMIGNPSGASGKMWLNESVAVDGAIGVARGEFDVHMDMLFHKFNWTSSIKNLPPFLTEPDARGELPFYFGLGARLLFEDDKEFGIRVPVGLSYLPANTPWETFIEVAPVFRTTPDFGVNGDFAIGLRYYFSAIRPQGTK